MEPLKPPAIVRKSSRTRAELEHEAKSLYRAREKNGDDLGQTLVELRAICKVGEWTPLLEKLGIPSSTAHDLMKKFKLPEESCTSGPEVQDEIGAQSEDERGDAWEPPASPTQPPAPQEHASTGFVPSWARNGTPEPPAPPKPRSSSTAPPTTQAEPQAPPAPETPADILKRVNSEIESFCRTLMKTAEDGLPDDYWLRHDNRREGALRKIKDACEALRSCKCSAICPKCDEGKTGNKTCVPCHGTGRLPKMNLDML